ncbi:DUF4870 family protein [Parvularcula marina]|uniref:DUF4870 family protein n=1 Tax=Parvularcula marina TaxID=2292771 RepID=UPI0035131B6C
MNEVQTSSATGTPTLVYALYFIALFTGVPFFIGVIIAYLARDGADATSRSHYDHQIAIFWRVFLMGLIIWIFMGVSAVLTVILIGFVGLLIGGLALLYLWVWTLVRCIRGVQASSNGQPYNGPFGWAI